MSITDVLAKWALQKVDEYVLDKEEVPINERIKKIYLFLEVLPNRCESLIQSIKVIIPEERYDKETIELSGMNASIVVLLNDGKWNDEVKKEHKIFIKNQKNFSKLGRPIVQDIMSLKFEFDRVENFKGFSEKICEQLCNFEFYLCIIEKSLADFEVAIKEKNESEFHRLRKGFDIIEGELKKFADNFRTIGDELLECSKKLQL